MTAVDEDQAERGSPQPGHVGGAAHHDDHVILEPGRGQRGPQARERVEAAGYRVDEARVVVLPAGLVLLGPAVVVDGDHDLAGGAGRRGEVDRGLAAVAADLQDRPEGRVGGGRFEQGPALGRGHEAGGGVGRADQVASHNDSSHESR